MNPDLFVLSDDGCPNVGDVGEELHDDPVIELPDVQPDTVRLSFEE